MGQCLYGIGCVGGRRGTHPRERGCHDITFALDHGGVRAGAAPNGLIRAQVKEQRGQGGGGRRVAHAYLTKRDEPGGACG